MDVQVHYQGIGPTPWMDQFISRRLEKLGRYLSNGATIQVHIKCEGTKYITSLAIHNFYNDYGFSAEGENLFESITASIDKASRAMAEQKRIIKDKINRRYFSLKKDLAS